MGKGVKKAEPRWGMKGGSVICLEEGVVEWCTRAGVLVKEMTCGRGRRRFNVTRDQENVLWWKSGGGQGGAMYGKSRYPETYLSITLISTELLQRVN